jgi:hypothetical protein
MSVILFAMILDANRPTNVQRNAIEINIITEAISLPEIGIDKEKRMVTTERILLVFSVLNILLNILVNMFVLWLIEHFKKHII